MRAYWQRYKPYIQGFGIAAVVSFIAWLGYTSVNAGNQAEKARSDVKVLRQASPCLAAKEDPTPAKLKLCHQSFGQAIALVTSPQACVLIAKGAPLLVIDGRRIGRIECVLPNGTKVDAAGNPLKEAGPAKPVNVGRTKNEPGSGTGHGGPGAEGGGSNGGVEEVGGGKGGNGAGGHHGGGTPGGSGGGAGGGGGGAGGEVGSPAPSGGSPEGDQGGGAGGGEVGSEGEEPASDGKGKAVGLEVLPEGGPPVAAEVPVLPVQACKNPLASLNC